MAVFVVSLKDSLPGIAVCKFCEANGDFADAEVRFGYPTHLRQHLDLKRKCHRKGHREAPKEHEARGAGSKSGGNGGTSSEKGAGSIIAYMDSAKPFTSKMVRFIIDSFNLSVVQDLRSSSTSAFRARLENTLVKE